jgi:hypothetical protein
LFERLARVLGSEPSLENELHKSGHGQRRRISCASVVGPSQLRGMAKANTAIDLYEHTTLAYDCCARRVSDELGSRRRVLVVDDEPMVTDWLKMVIEGHSRARRKSVRRGRIARGRDLPLLAPDVV